MVSIGDVDRWEPDQVHQIFAQVQRQLGSIGDATRTLVGLPALASWGGPAGDAARESIGRTVGDFKGHGNEIEQVGVAAKDTADQIQELKRELAAERRVADEFGLSINEDNSVTGTMPAQWSHSPEGQQLWNQAKSNLQNWVAKFLAKAEQVDEDLAAAIQGADGVLPVVDEDPKTNSSSIARTRNRKLAFYEHTGRWPTSDNDWRMAAMLDPHTYDPKYKGKESVVQVKKIHKVKGGGLQWANAFIPRKSVGNFPHANAGDARGYDPTAEPEHSRVSMAVDYDDGLVVMRQNPSVDARTGAPKVGHPTFGVAQDPDNHKDVQITFEAKDPYAPGLSQESGPLPPLSMSGGHDSLADPLMSALGVSVRGTLITHAQTPGATPSLEGNLTNYPAWEVYSSPDSQNNQYVPPGPSTVYQYMPDKGQNWGPLLHLPGHHSVKVP